MTFKTGDEVRFKFLPDLTGTVEDFSSKVNFKPFVAKNSEEEFKEAGLVVVEFKSLETAVIVSTDALELLPSVLATENSLHILKIFQEKGSRADDVLMMNAFMAYATKNMKKIRGSDLNQGINDAEKNGWIELKNEGISLTQAGYAAIRTHNNKIKAI